jgi:protein involved in polysaccharide export with SLBB domain
MTYRVRALCVCLLATLLFLRGAEEARAQAVDGGRANATRQELERLADEADAVASSGGPAELRQAKQLEAAAIRGRLREGDFRAGDRIVVAVQGDSTLNDTLVVLPGPRLKLLSLPEDSLRGVLRSELQSHLVAWVTRYYKNTTVHATPLIRFGVLGEVNHPGYYRLPANVDISDAIMTAGGPTQRADIPRTVVRRRSQDLLSKAAVRDAMVAGRTLDELGLDAGDELVVGARPERNWMNVVQIATVLSGLALAVLSSRAF